MGTSLWNLSSHRPPDGRHNSPESNTTFRDSPYPPPGPTLLFFIVSDKTTPKNKNSVSSESYERDSLLFP